jgi:hypothetical protein
VSDPKYQNIHLPSFAQNRELVLELSAFRKGVTAPTDSTLGTTPTVPTLLFDATNELLSLGTVMPFGWDKGANVEFITIWALAATQLDLDALDVTVDYIAFDKETTGAGLLRTSTQLLGSTAVTADKGLAIGDIYTVSSPFAFDDANNPFNPLTIGFAAEIHLTNVAEVASAHLVAACISYRALF